jgi:cytochrome oxidase Cu insertion factor (SCO1/SenC/PrrC family)
MRLRSLLFAAATGVLLFASGPLRSSSEATEPTAAQLMEDLMWGNGPVGGPFALTDHVGRRRTEADFRGKLLLIYFGYMFCPDICPTDLQAMGSAIDRLGPSGDSVQPLFITLDPERDTPDQLADYVTAFHPRLVGLTGSEGEIKSVARAYKVYYTRATDPRTTDYILNHSAFIYLVDVDGKYLGFFPPGTTADRMIEVLRPQVTRLPAR